MSNRVRAASRERIPAIYAKPKVAGRSDIDDPCVKTLVSQEPLRDGHVRGPHARAFHNTDGYLTGGAGYAHPAQARCQTRSAQDQATRVDEKSASRASPARHFRRLA